MGDQLTEVLSQVKHPIRYLGGEYNCPGKWAEPGQVRFALIYPDIYEIGMSNYGLKILYHILARRKDTFVDRAYAPWPDFGAALKQKKIPLYGVESKIPLNEFDILGFSMQSELCFTNLLYILDLSGIPLESDDRDETQPLVIAGGPCCYNPLPLARFIDGFVIGDGEEVVEELIDAYKGWARKDRDALLSSISAIEGVWVPKIHGRERRIRKRIVQGLKYENYPVPILPICAVTHDRLTVEVSRGCIRGCRFCQSGMVNRPIRFRPPEDVVRLAAAGIEATGWEEVSLLSLSVLDYPSLKGVLAGLNSTLARDRVSLSLPSLRGECFDEDSARLLSQVKRTGLTFAPETASERLQRSINKLVDRDQLLKALRIALDYGWSKIKLYFMFGLPGETDEDLKEVVRLIQEIVETVPGFLLRLSFTPFIPKPHTPFQWVKFCERPELEAKVQMLKAGLPRRRVKVRFHKPEASYLEAVLSRGDEALALVLKKVYAHGGIFQEWSEFFNFEDWLGAFQATGVDPDQYLRARDLWETLSWEFIDAGIEKRILADEYLRSVENRPTGGHRPIGFRGARINPLTINLEPISGPVQRFRLRYRVYGNFQYAGHLDRVRAIYRALRRSRLPILYTQGFSPHPVVSFGPPLPVGVTSRAEYLDLPLEGYDNDLVQDLNRVLPEGLFGLEFRRLPTTAPSLGRSVNLAEYWVHSSNGIDPGHIDGVQGVYQLERTGPETFLLWLKFAPGIRLFPTLKSILGAKPQVIKVERQEVYSLKDGVLRNPLEEL